MTTIKAGDEVRVLDLTGGCDPKVATVAALQGAYIIVRYERPTLGRRVDQFYAESGWRAWDGELRWRIESFVTKETTP